MRQGLQLALQFLLLLLHHLDLEPPPGKPSVWGNTGKEGVKVGDMRGSLRNVQVVKEGMRPHPRHHLCMVGMHLRSLLLLLPTLQGGHLALDLQQNGHTSGCAATVLSAGPSAWKMPAPTPQPQDYGVAVHLLPAQQRGGGVEGGGMPPERGTFISAESRFSILRTAVSSAASPPPDDASPSWIFLIAASSWLNLPVTRRSMAAIALRDGKIGENGVGLWPEGCFCHSLAGLLA